MFGKSKDSTGGRTARRWWQRRAREAVTSVGCIILGRGEDDKKVHEWLANAAVVPGFIGFAVGRTDFWQPLVEWRANKITRGEAVAEVARRYREFVSIFEQASLMREKRESKKGGAAR